MKAKRLNEFPISHFEYLFTPSGLPLVVKGEDEHGTTSILVRGGAGAGKTTLAMALAHAIAKAGGGLVLYLTTEFSPAEIAYKATLIGLTEESVDVWPGTEGAKAGDVVVEHLSVVRDGKPVLTSVERKKSAIDAVWGLLHPEKEGELRPPLPVRAVVIDALTLPDAGEEEKSLRSDLVAFVQSLENEGVSVVLVEEQAAGVAAWAAFVVDVVIELSLQPEEGTRELRRKLTLTKCRYTRSIPGPHDYSIFVDAVSVWPDLLRVHAAHGSDLVEHYSVDGGHVAVPVDAGSWVHFGPGVVVSPFDTVGLRAIHLLGNTPGLRGATVRCGAITTILTAGRELRLSDEFGIEALGWLILYTAKSADFNYLTFENVDALFSWPGSASAVVHMFETLVACGLLVCAHGRAAAMAPLDPIADYWWDGRMRGPVPSPRRRHLNVTRWLFRDLVLGASKIDGTARTALAGVLTAMEQGEHVRASNELWALDHQLHMKQYDFPGRNSMDTIVAYAVISNWVHGAGSVRQHVGEFWPSDIARNPYRENEKQAWHELALGEERHVGSLAAQGVQVASPSADAKLLWSALCAIVTRNRAATDILIPRACDPEDDLHVLDPLLRALGGQDRIDEADRIITEFGARHSLAPWMQDRLRAETRLDSYDLSIVGDAAARLERLDQDLSLPITHRAEIAHNLGIAKDRLGDREAALAAFNRARAINPVLRPCRTELQRLESPEQTPT